MDTSITSNITKVRIRRNLEAKINQFAQYELCFDNTFHTKDASYNIKSTGFNVSGISGTVYFSDTVITGTNKGNLFLFQLSSDTEVTVISNNFGSVDYEKGEVMIDTVNITSTLLPDNIIEIQAIPDSNDVLARKELYLQFSVAKSNFYMRQDSISTGANTSGTRYDVESSYSNGSKVRGAIVPSTTNATTATLVGYVDGQPYFGAFHTMDTGTKMTGAVHTSSSKEISNTPLAPIDTSSGTTTSYTSSTSSSSSSSSY